LRKLSVYMKGQIGHFDYRVALSKPMVATAFNTLNASTASFSTFDPKLQQQAYVNYQFFDKENNTLAYTTGPYLGKNKVLNLGAGIINQNKAMWKLTEKNDTTFSKMTLIGVDLFMEIPLSEKHNCISTYLAFSDYQMGKNFVRNLGVNNPANGVNSNATFNGAGNNFPMIGTGQTFYGQLAYKFKDDLVPENGSIQLYGNTQYSKLQALKDPVLMYEAGVNWFIHGTHNAKFTLGYQNRPVFNTNATGDVGVLKRLSMAVIQYQVSL
jgi:hypothetical protein